MGSPLRLFGDFQGRGVWTFTQEGERVRVSYDWKIKAGKPLLRAFSFLLKPVFSANHRWAMAMGEKSLVLELARRRALSAEQAARIPQPPGPTFPHNLRKGARLRSTTRLTGS
jgi:hypothetical protein